MTIIPADTVRTARGKSIADVALALGADKGVLVSERGVPCPGCGGTDRFSVDTGKNVFLCRASGAAGDPIDLVRHVHDCGFAKAIDMLAGRAALPARPARKADPSDRFRQDERRRAWRIWENGYSIDPAKGGRLVKAYLALRGIPFPGWRLPALREADRVDYFEWSKERQEFVRIHSGPAMLAAITGPDGHFIGLHRTWIDLDRPNGKAVIADPETGEILDAKKVRGSQRGGKIVLREPGHVARRLTGDLAIGEGIETVLSWDALADRDGCALWCGINLDNIAGKAAAQIPHPSATFRDSLGRQRRRKVGGPEPDLDDRDCLMAPAHFSRRILLGDADGDRFGTQAAMIRARKRLETTSGPTEIDWAPDGQDFNDALRLASRDVSRPAGAVAPAGRATTPDARSGLRPAADGEAQEQRAVA